MDNLEKSFDFAIIGTGISTSLTLLNFINLVEELDLTAFSQKINFIVIDKFSELSMGIPYGTKSDYSYLLTNINNNFLSDKERKDFMIWLQENKYWLVEDLLSNGGIVSKNWFESHKIEIINNSWRLTSIPRRFFEFYIDWKLKEKIKSVDKNFSVQILFVYDEVNDLEKKGNEYQIFSENHGTLKSKKVILSFEKLPLKQSSRFKKFENQDTFIYINEFSKKRISSVLNSLEVLIDKQKDLNTNILIIGNNENESELLNNLKKLDSKSIKFTILSPRDKISNSDLTNLNDENFQFENLSKLNAENQITAKSISEAIYKDFDLYENTEFNSTIDNKSMSSYFQSFFSKMENTELEQFACYYGNEIIERRRFSEIHRIDFLKTLRDDNKLIYVYGKFKDLIWTNDNKYSLIYTNRDSDDEFIHSDKYDIVIKFEGKSDLYSDNITPLFKNIITKGYATPNNSKIGFNVNEMLKATADNLFVVGSLLTGNIIENKPIWDIEYSDSIFSLPALLSKKLIKEYDTSIVKTVGEYKFEIRCLNKDSDILYYKNLLKNEWNNNIYYVPEHLEYFKNKGDSLKYFLFKKNDSNIILMPIILRKIENNEDKNLKFYDAITPYGYSGPLIKNKTTEEDIKFFWQYIDTWYFSNNVITEFIRFSLNKNYTGYSGLLVSSLLNVKGNLRNSFDEQWNSFLPKVRNNYRKAQTYNLEFEHFIENDITDDVILKFYKIYTGTMKRHNAKDIYFFSLDYFKNLIFNNEKEFQIVFTIFENKPISTELIIKIDDTLYAFLGGTDSNYYHCRPNDFLRVEVIKWAIANNYKHYILGGGLKDGDGLYKHKKSLFPKDEDIMFYTGRKIINHNIYNLLCSIHLKKFPELKEEEMQKNFFPLYRFNNH